MAKNAGPLFSGKAMGKIGPLVYQDRQGMARTLKYTRHKDAKSHPQRIVRLFTYFAVEKLYKKNKEYWKQRGKIKRTSGLCEATRFFFMNHPRAFYPLDEGGGPTSQDISPYKNPIDIILGLWVAARHNYALKLNVSGTGAAFGEGVQQNFLNSDDFSYVVWFRAPASFITGKVLWRAGPPLCAFYLLADATRFILYDDDGTSSGWLITGGIADDMWHCLIAVRTHEDDYVRFYIDNILRVSRHAVFAGNFTANGLTWIIQTINPHVDGFMVDSPQIYPFALSESDRHRISEV